jgi:signal peptide peptidase SppA
MRLLPARFRPAETIIPVVRLHGAIMSGGSQFRPALNLASAAGLIEKAFSFKQAPAVAFSVNSPGGSAVQSRFIYKRIRDLAAEKDKKVFMFVEDVAASGGYMIACAGDEIVADPSSIVGSIGVVYQAFGVQELMERIGVESRVHTAGKNKVMLSPFQPEKKQDVAHLKAMQGEIHAIFIDLVKQSRDGKLADDPDLFTGLFWTGGKARELGLVDHIGDMRSFLKERYGEKTRLVLLSPPRGLFGRRAAGAAGAAGAFSSTGFGSAVGAGLISALEERALWAHYGL